MYQKIILCEEVKGYDLNKFFKEKEIVKEKGLDFTTDDFFKRLEDCALSVRIVNAMRIQDIRTIGELLQYPADQFKQLRHIGAGSVLQIREYISDNYPSINLGGLNHVMSFFWSFRDAYSLPHEKPIQLKKLEVNINGYCMPVAPSSSIKIVTSTDPKNEYCDTIIIQQIYQNGSRSKTLINVRLLLDMSAKQFITQFNQQCNDLWMDQLKIKKN
jgi:hypothetical protein